MSFDRLAPIYSIMESVLAGRALQRCRTALLFKVPAPRSILIAGEGHGRSLSACLQAFPGAATVVVESSAGMIRQARNRLQRLRLDFSRVDFIQEDVLTWSPPPGRFDLIVTHFFLDCFSESLLPEVVAKLAVAASQKASWLNADFQIARCGLARWRSKMIVSGLYRLFRLATDISARRLHEPAPALAAAGFRLRERRVFECELLKSEWWSRD